MIAIFSEDRVHRYRLEREVQPEGVIASVIMVNGSVADEKKNDSTVIKLIGFGQRLGWRRIIIGNKFGFAAQDIKALRGATDPIGPDNDRHLEQIIADSDLTVVAWGAMAKLPSNLRKRWIDIVRMLDRAKRVPMCLGINHDGHPTHPVMTGYDVPLTTWHAPWFPNRWKDV
jgi:hypothetical protein